MWSLQDGKTAGDSHLYLSVSSRVSTFVDLLAVEPLNPIPDLGEPIAERIAEGAKPRLLLTLPWVGGPSCTRQDTEQPPGRGLHHRGARGTDPRPPGVTTKTISRHGLMSPR